MTTIPRTDDAAAADTAVDTSSESTFETRPASVRTRFRGTRQMFHNKTFVISFSILMLFVLLSLLAPLLAAYDPNELHTDARLEGPSGDYWLGTDTLGRDLYSRLLYGGGVTLRAALTAVGVGMAIGIPTGFLAGYVQRRVDTVLSTISDTMQAMPGLLFALGIITALGPGVTNAMFAIGIILTPAFFRISRTAAMSVRSSTYVEAARSVGCSGPRIIARHVFPNTAGPLLVIASFGFSAAIVVEATLSFLGLGVEPPDASWGTLTREAFSQIRFSSWGIYPPIVAIVIVVVSISLMADTIQESLARPGGRR